MTICSTRIESRNPTSSDKGEGLGSLWVNKLTNQSWQLTSCSSSSYVWTPLNGSSELALGKISVDICVDPGVNPVTPNKNGCIAMHGSQLPNGAAPQGIAIASLDANSVLIGAQVTGTSPNCDPCKNGISHFDSHYFKVDENGLVSLLDSFLNEIRNLKKEVATLKEKIG